MPADLRPNDNPVEIKINPLFIVLMSFIFALVFWIIGIAFRYYVYVGGSV